MARATPDAPAVIEPGRAWSHAEVDERMRRLAGFLLRREVKARDRVAVLSRNRREILEVVGGALRAGIVPVPVNPLLTAPEVAYIIEDSAARWLLTDGSVEGVTAEHVVTFGDAYERCLHGAPAAEVADVALGRPMHYTSGTTGRPKGVWVEPAAEGTAAARAQRFRSLWALVPDDRHLVCSPLAHSAPLRFALRTLEAGGSVVLLERFDPRAALAAIELFGIASTFMVPIHLERILALGPAGLPRHDVSSLRLLAHAGAPIRRVTKERVLEAFPKGSVWEFYGATEGQATRISSDEWRRKPGSVGRPNPGARVLVLGNDGRDLIPGEIGEIWIQDPHAERFEYWGNPEVTAAAWRHDAFGVGDLGYLDDDGYLFLTGRKHDVIISGGVNVYPQEVEETLRGHPDVAEAAVYGVPDDEWGQRVEAAVVATPGVSVDADSLRSWLRRRLAGYKCPRRITPVSELPRSPTGKLVRRPPDDG